MNDVNEPSLELLIAANRAALAATAGLDSGYERQNLIGIFQDCDLFKSVAKHRYSGESVWLHLIGHGKLPFHGDWKHVRPDIKISFIMYADVVLLLARYVKVDAPAMEPRAAEPGRGFDSIHRDSENRGTIYDREDWAKPRPGGAAPATEGTGAPEMRAGRVAEAPPAGDDVQDDADDVTADSDPEIVVDHIDGEYGDVVDDDDPVEGAEEGMVEGDDDLPPVTVVKPARRRQRRSA